jgi:hypothetical protein
MSATMRESWTDERLDDFRGEVNRRFDEAERRTDARFDAVDRRLELLDDRFHSLQRTLIVTGGGMIATLIAACASLVLTQG